MLSKQIGLSIQELEYMTIGGLVDYANTYSDEMEKAKSKKPKDKVRKATQADIDAL